MWTSLLAALALAPAQPPAAGLNLSNVRNTYGELGGTRPESPHLPGDVVFTAFDIEGLPVNDQGQVTYTMAMEVFDKAGKSIYKQDPATKIDFAPLGGPKIPARAFVTIGVDQAPGEYRLVVTVTDPGTKASKSLERKFEVKPREFGIVAVYTSVDPEGRYPIPTTGVVGQACFVQFGVIAFTRDPAKKQPSVMVEMLVVDEQGKPTIAKPISYPVDANVPEADLGVNIRFQLPMTRAGKYTVKLRATDKLNNKTATFDLPIAVLPAAN